MTEKGSVDLNGEPETVELAKKLLIALGVDVTSGSTKDTPRRVVDMYKELLAGMGQDPLSVLSETFPAGHEEMVAVRKLYFSSLCEHHMLPFFGHAHVAYIPNSSGRIVGLSKIAKLVEVLSRRPQVQERLTTEIAQAMESALAPRGVIVVLEAEHLCMSIRGTRQPGAMAVTSAIRGVFRKDPATRAEALRLIGTADNG